MIKINLLPQKRARARAAADASPGSRDLLVGIAALAGAAVVVYLVVDRPVRSHRDEMRDSIDSIDQDIKRKNKDLEGYDKMKKSAEEAAARVESINHLMAARVVPANVLHELGEILTPNHSPTMTEAMAKKTGNGPESDPNKRFDLQWDPSHVWLTSFTDTGGVFKLEGGAQGDVDVTQLSKRMAASVYFFEVESAQEDRVVDKDTGVNYFKFTLTGKVAY